MNKSPKAKTIPCIIMPRSSIKSTSKTGFHTPKKTKNTNLKFHSKLTLNAVGSIAKNKLRKLMILLK